MKNETVPSEEILAKTQEINNHFPQLARHLVETPVLTFDYAEPGINQQEMEDYHDSLSIMIQHSDATSIGDNGMISSHPRPDARRVLDAALLEFDLNKEIENIKLEGNWKAGIQSAKTLVKSENMRVLLIAMHQHNEMKMHQANGPISMQVLEGNVQFMTWQNCVTIKAGQFITLHKKVQHNLMAHEQSILLLTIFHMHDDKKDEPEEQETGEKDKEVVEKSANINFPDFPTYPPEDDVYIEPVETVTPQ